MVFILILILQDLTKKMKKYHLYKEIINNWRKGIYEKKSDYIPGESSDKGVPNQGH